MKPRIFVSTVTSEFKTARTKIEHVLEFLGYEVEQQDIFGTEGGDLRQMLREKIDACDALIQLAGDAYGAEPPTVDADFGRVSYTQFEFLYARLQGKKTYVLFAGADCQKDKPTTQLDLPRETNHPDPAAHQAELRDLQSAYRARLRSEGHLWHSPADDTALENSVLKLRNDSEQLRKEFKDWQKSLAKSQTRTSRNLLLLTALLLLLGIGGYLAWQTTRTQLTELSQPKPLDKSRLREHLTTASEKALARDLAAANAIQGDWEKRQKLNDAANAAHQQRLSRVNELADEFATLDTGENTSSTLSEMLRILDEENIDSALAYLTSQSIRLVEKATAKTEAARADLQPLLTGAQLAIANGQPEKAEALFQQLLTPGLPDWPQARHEYWGYLVDTKGTRQQTHESLAAALVTYREAELQSRLLTLKEPHNTTYLRALSVSHNRLGDIARAQGDLPAAAMAYTASLEIRQALAAHDPQNTQWQRDLSVCLHNLADIAEVQRDRTSAAKALTSATEIAHALVARDPENTQWLRDLSVCHDKQGNNALRHGDLPAADKAYTARHKIAQDLAARDPENTQWQSDLSASYYKLGDIAVAQGDLPAAAKAYTAALEIAQALAARDPQNTLWQRDLSISHAKLGDIAKAQGDLPAAAKAYTAALEIARALAARDPQNTLWQRDLSNCHERCGDIAVAQDDLPAAAKAYTACLEIRRSLAARAPEHPELQRDLLLSHYTLAQVALLRGHAEEAQLHYRKSHDILQAIADKGEHVSPEDMKTLEWLKEKAGIE